jgi:hypothetical protein|tara:strand:+ start:213 stop:470 length:258 start_codon:yes stop_codon:yes gene_type:complete
LKKKTRIKKDKSNILGILSIVFGSVGLIVFGFVFGIAGLICGIIGYKKEENQTLSIIGIILSSISLFLSILVLFGIIAFFSLLGL